VRRTAMCGRAAPTVACGEGEVGEAHNALRFLEQERGGPRGHRSRRIDEEFPRWHRSPWWGQLENAVVSVGLNGEGVARGTEEDTRPNPAHRRGGWCGVEAGRRELASAAMAEKKTTSVRGLNECKTKQ
jgi:hypothetical protein